MSVEPHPRLQAAAEQWMALQDSELSQDEVTKWLDWLEQEPENTESFNQINELAQRLRHTRDIAPKSLGLLRGTALTETASGEHARARIEGITGAAFPARASRVEPRRRSLQPLAIAAAVLVVVGGALVWALLGDRVATNRAAGAIDRGVYSTSIANQREVLLPDGSHVTLGGASSIEAVFSAERREVFLLAGEAFFKVQKDVRRPFVVNADIATVRALGTAFNVRKNDGRIAVTVAEGRVEVARAGNRLERLAAAAGLQQPRTAQLGRAEQLIVESQATSLRVVRTDPQRATAWREGRLEFADEPLDVVIDNVSRYSRVVLRADDPRLHAITYTGTFVPGQLESWLGALENVFGLEIHRQDESTTVRLRDSAQ